MTNRYRYSVSACLFAGALAILAITAARAAAPIRVMLLDGESAGTYHDWQRTTPALRKMLEETGLFEVSVVTAPSAAAAATAPFTADFSKYQVVVLNYDAPDERWSSEAKSGFERFVQNGGGVVAVHAADNAFAGWPAFNNRKSTRLNSSHLGISY